MGGEWNMLKIVLPLSATIFMDLVAWQKDMKVCFGVRFNFSMLPKGSIVVGFVTQKQDGVSKAIYAPTMTEDQRKCWDLCVEYIEDVLDKGFTQNQDKYWASNKIL
jgi:hypothetical protein